jgi:phage FluMu protein Com
MQDKKSQNDSSEKLFAQVVKEACRDSKISQQELEIMKRLAQLLGLGTEQGNLIANEIIADFKAGKLDYSQSLSSEELYRSILTAFAADQVIDSHEEALLENIKSWLNLETTEEIKAENSEDEQIIQENGDIKPLRCSNCNGQIPLLRKPEIKCPYCLKINKIPTRYLEALASRESFERRQRQAKQLIEKLGKPPTTFECLISELNEKAFLASFVCSLGVILGLVQMLIFYPLDWFYSGFYNINMSDVISSATPALISTIASFFLAIIPFAFLYYFRRKVLSLKHLKVALAARSPQKSGGPSTCRFCGGPFEVAPDAVGITCPYCQTDNLLHVPDEWLRETRDTSIKVGKSAVMAENVFKKETRMGWESVLSLFLLFLFLGALNWWFISFRNDSMYLKNEIGWLPEYYQEIKNQTHIRLSPKSGRDDEKLETWIKDARYIEEFHVALGPEQKLTLNWELTSEYNRQPKNSRLEVMLYIVRSYSSGFMALQKKQELAVNETFEFNADPGGWYKIKMFQTNMDEFKIRVKITDQAKKP